MSFSRRKTGPAVCVFLAAAAIALSTGFLPAPAAVNRPEDPRLAGNGGEDQIVARYREAAEKIRMTGLAQEKAYEFLQEITGVGPRLTGSPGAAAAVERTRQMMLRLGLENVHEEEVIVQRWERGAPERAEVLAAGRRGPKPLAVCALGGSVATPPGGVSGEVVEVHSLDELPRLGRALAGKIVFFNRPMDRTLSEPFAAYGGGADQRVQGAVAAARQGAAAVLVRSLTLRIDDHPHTGLMTYEKGVPEIPAAAVSTRDADVLSALMKSEGKVRVSLTMSCRSLGPVASANVVGDLTGTELPKEIVLVGGHLDSWDLGTGAHDDGAGCAASLEAVRLLKDLGLRSKRTVRVVFFMDEEFGGTGGRFYVRDSERQGETHLAAFELDRGGFIPLALAAGGSDPAVQARFRAWMPLFAPLGIDKVVPGGGGVDVGPLIRAGSLPGAVIPESQTYFDYHHSSLDVAGAVHPRELEFQALILATAVYLLAQEGLR